MSAEEEVSRGPAPPEEPPKAAGRKRRRRWPWVILALVALYTLLGFVVLPWAAKSQIDSFVRETLGRQGGVERVRFNPYTFTLGLEGAAVGAEDGSPLLSFDELFVDFELTSVVGEAWTLAEIRLVKPHVGFVRFADGETSFSRLLAALGGEEEKPEPEEPSGEPVPVLIRKLSLEAGEVDFVDETVPSRFETHVGPISFELRNFGTLPDSTGEQRFELVTESGARLVWTGTVQMAPPRSVGHVSAKGERLRLVWRYLRDRVGFEIADGTAVLDVDYDFRFEKEPRITVHDLGLTVENVVVKPKGGGNEVLRLPRLALTGGRVEWPASRVHLGELRVTGLRADVERDEEGAINLVRLLAPESRGAAAPPAGAAPAEAPAPEDGEAAREGGAGAAPAVADEPEPPAAEEAAQPEEGGAAPEKAAPAADPPAREAVAAAEEEADAAEAAAAAEPTAGGAVGAAGDAAPVEPEKPAAGEEPAPEKAAAGEGTWSVRLDRFLIEDLGVSYDDRTFDPPIDTGLKEFRLEVLGVSNHPGAVFDVDLSTAIASGGKIAVKGKVGADPVDVDAGVQVDELSLLPAQAFLTPVAQLKLESGTLSIDGTAKSGTEETFSFDGTLLVDELSTKDTLADERFLAWKELKISNLAVRLDGRSVEAERIDLAAPYLKIVIAKNGTTNVGEVMTPPGEPPPGAESQRGTGASAQPAPDAAGGTSEPFRIDLGRVDVEEGSATFADLSLPLPFDTGIHSLGGKISGIRAGHTGSIDLKGRVGRYGETKVKGKVAFFAPTNNADVNVVFRNLEMTGFTPYSAKFAGYRIERGKMTLDLTYRLKNRSLDSENRIVLDEFTLGEKVESPDAIDAPLHLAVALLKDSDGKIDLAVPVSGSLDSPEFGYGQAIRSALKNLIVRAATAPFNLLGSLVGAGGDEELGYVWFAPGEAELAPPQQESLAKLADALVKRPQLQLDVRGRYHAELDELALKKAKVQERIATRLEEEGDDDPETRREVVEDLFLEQFSKTEMENLESASTRVVQAPGGAEEEAEPRFDEDSYLEALRARLATRETVATGELEALAEARAESIAAFLTEQGIPAERIRRGPPNTTKKTRDGRVRVKLGLSG